VTQACGPCSSWGRVLLGERSARSMTDLTTALALVLVVEGTLWALFPEQMKQAAARAALLDSGPLRMGGLASVLLGVGLVWLLRR